MTELTRTTQRIRIGRKGTPQAMAALTPTILQKSADNVRRHWAPGCHAAAAAGVSTGRTVATMDATTNSKIALDEIEGLMTGSTCGEERRASVL